MQKYRRRNRISLSLRQRLIELVKVSCISSLCLRVFVLFVAFFWNSGFLKLVCLFGIFVYIMTFLIAKLKKYSEKYHWNYYILHAETCFFVCCFLSMFGFGYGVEIQLVIMIVLSYFTVAQSKVVSYSVAFFEIILFLYLYYACPVDYSADNDKIKPLLFIANFITLSFIFYQIQVIFKVGKYLKIIVAENQKRYFDSKSSHDRLTEVLNVYSFKELLTLKLLSSDFNISSLAFISINIVDFHAINNSGGYAAGDKVLKLCAKTLRNSCESDQLVARVGGDRFMVAIFNEDEEYVKKLAESILDSIKFNQLSIYKISLELNIGICFSYFTSFNHINKIIQEAVLNMDLCKQRQENVCFSIYKSSADKKYGLWGGGFYGRTSDI